MSDAPKVDQTDLPNSAEPSYRVLGNSLWMVIQPLVLNVLSIAVIGYIARVLRQEDYGRFVFGFSFVAMFSPFANMGLRAVTVREVAKQRAYAGDFIDKVLSARLALALLSAAAAVVVITLAGHDAGTRCVVYLASLTIVFQAATTTFLDVFQAHERMKQVAYAQAASGLVLTALSVVAVFAGFGVIGLTLSYVLGGLAGLLITGVRFATDYRRPRLNLDVGGSWARIVEAGPFFVPSLVATAGSKVGIVILSSLSGYSAVAFYGAASGLVERLAVVPDGICTALFPTMTVVYRRSPEEAGRLFRQFFLFSMALALPLAVGTTLLASRILVLVYGARYAGAAGVLQVLVWWLFVTFLTSVASWTLGAIHRERQDGLIKVLSTVMNVLLCVILTGWFGEKGTAGAALVAAGSAAVMLAFCIKRYLTVKIIDAAQVVKVMGATAAMAVICHLMRQLNVGLIIGAGVVTYAGALWATGIVTRDDARTIAGMMRDRHRVEGGVG